MSYVGSPRSVIEATAPPDGSWIVDVLRARLNLDYLRVETVWNRPPSTVHRNMTTMREDRKNVYRVDLLFYQKVDEKPKEMFDFMVQQCTTVQYVIVGLAHHLSAKSVDTICRLIFSKKDLDPSFVEGFYVAFFPEYLQGKYSWFSLDLLVRAQASWPFAFRRLLRKLFKNVRIPNHVLSDFVANMNTEQRKDIMSAIMEVAFMADEFAHHTRTINEVFKDCDKTVEECQFIFYNLEAHASACYTNRGYGLLMYTLLNNLGDTPISQRAIKDVIDQHGSVYKAPCLSAFDEIIGEIVAVQFRFQDIPRLFLPAPDEPGSRSL